MSICKNCRKEYQPERKTSRYCSIKCWPSTYKLAHVKKSNKKRKCVYCNSEFKSPQLNARFCSENCRKSHWRKSQLESI